MNDHEYGTSAVEHGHRVPLITDCYTPSSQPPPDIGFVGRPLLEVTNHRIEESHCLPDRPDSRHPIPPLDPISSLSGNNYHTHPLPDQGTPNYNHPAHHHHLGHQPTYHSPYRGPSSDNHRGWHSTPADPTDSTHRRSHPAQLDEPRDRSIPLSTPSNSSSSSNHNADHLPPPNYPPPIHSPDLHHQNHHHHHSHHSHHSQPSSLSLNLPEIVDHRYHPYQHHTTSTPHHSQRPTPRPLAGSYDSFQSYHQSLPPPPQYDYHHNRIPSSPSSSNTTPPLYRSFTQPQPQHHGRLPNPRTFNTGLFTSPPGISGPIHHPGPKRKMISSGMVDDQVDEGKSKRLNTQSNPPHQQNQPSDSSDKLLHVQHSKEGGHQRMTTILCLHASVAQKSYGQEKRFLCPPPLVRIIGPYRKLSKPDRPILSMSILNEEGERHLSQTAFLGEEHQNTHFKSLHISGAEKKAKHVTLELSLHPPLVHHNHYFGTNSANGTYGSGHNQHNNTGPELDQLGPAFATFGSEECSIISKPSKKTAKARNTQSCIFNGSTICLFNRINSQTVRTKYLCVEDDKLAARASQWSAFTINVIRRAEDGLGGLSSPLATKTLLSSSVPGADRTVTYGSEVELIDFVTGISSGALIVRKVEKNKVQKDATGPISQMQKLAFCKIDKNDPLNAIYISALESGRYANGVNHQHTPHAGLGSPFEMGSTHESNSNALVPTISVDTTTASMGMGSLDGLQYQAPRAVLPAEEKGGMTLDEIDDSVAWTVIGVSHFSHTFFDLSHNYPQIPQEPITPLPRILNRPKIELEAMTISMTLCGFFDAHANPMEIWLGPLGPLTYTILNTTGLTLTNDGGNEDGIGGGVRLQISEHTKQQEANLLINLPSIEAMYLTLHQESISSDAMIILDESNTWIGKLMGRRLNETKMAIPTLPITLIRGDGMSFVLAHSVCVAQSQSHSANVDEPNTSGSGTVCILKVI